MASDADKRKGVGLPPFRGSAPRLHRHLGDQKKIRRGLVLVSLVIVGNAPVGASAHDHEPPSTAIRTESSLQRGRLGSYCWWRAAGYPGLYGQQCVEKIRTFPRARSAPNSRRAVVRFLVAHRPRRIELFSSRTKNGRRRHVAFFVTPHKRDGRVVAYDANFRLPRRAGDYFLDASGRWLDREGSKKVQHAEWTFRLRLR